MSGKTIQVPDELTYANGAILKDRNGNVFWHDGRPFIQGSGKMWYPSWQGGGVFRENRGMGGKLFYRFPDGEFLVEYNDAVYYPKSAAHPRKQFFSGADYYYRNGQRMMPYTGYSDSPFYHPNGQLAWDKRNKVFDPGGNPIPEGQDLVLRESFEPMAGGILTTVRRDFGEVRGFDVEMWMDPIHGYVFPLSWRTENQTPREFMREIIVQMETGYPGEVFSILVLEKGGLKFKLELFPPPPQEPPSPYPPHMAESQVNAAVHFGENNQIGNVQINVNCAHRIASEQTSFNTGDPPDFIRADRTR